MIYEFLNLKKTFRNIENVTFHHQSVIIHFSKGGTDLFKILTLNQIFLHKSTI